MYLKGSLVCVLLTMVDGALLCRSAYRVDGTEDNVCKYIHTYIHTYVRTYVCMYVCIKLPTQDVMYDISRL